MMMAMTTTSIWLYQYLVPGRAQLQLPVVLPRRLVKSQLLFSALIISRPYIPKPARVDYLVVV